MISESVGSIKVHKNVKAIKKINEIIISSPDGNYL